MQNIGKRKLSKPKKRAVLSHQIKKDKIFGKGLVLSVGFITLVMLFYSFYPAFASPPATPYAPGQTTNPTCSSGDTNCTVYPPLATTLSTSTAIITGTSSLQFAYDANNYTSFAVASDGSLTIGGNFLRILTNGNIGIGTSIPVQKLSVVGNISNIISSSTAISQVGTAAVGLAPVSIFVSGKYAYTADYTSNTISVVDISNPSAPIKVGSATVGTNPFYVFVSGRYAYVTNYLSDNISIVDISNPSSPRQVATVTVGAQPISVFVSGRYAYVANFNSNSVSVIDVANPLLPVVVASVLVGNDPSSIFVSSRYAYVVNSNASSMSVVDVSNPSAPVVIATTLVGVVPYDIYVSGRYAYIVNQTLNSLSVVDVSNPSAPVVIATTSAGNTPTDVFVSGRYAYITNDTPGTLTIVDVSVPSSPVVVATTSIGLNPYSVFVSGRYAYTANSGSDSISVVDISGTEVTSLIAHSADVGSLQSRNNVFAQGNVMAGTSLIVGAGGIQSQGAVSVFASSTGSVSPIFSVDSAQRSSILKIFATGTVSIGTSTAGNYKLYIDAGGSSGAGVGVNGFVKATGFITGSTTLDIAETYPLDPQCGARGNCPKVGDVVCASEDVYAKQPGEFGGFFIEQCAVAAADKIIGVVSGNPGFILGGTEARDLTVNKLYSTSFMPVALAGRVLVHVSTINGKIKAGDYLTSSAIPGVAIKATEPGNTIGTALQSFDGSISDRGAITVFVNNGWDLGSPVLSGSSVKGFDSQESIMPDFTKVILDKFTVAVKNSLKKLGLIIKNGAISAVEIFANTVNTHQLCLDGTCINKSQLQQILQKANE